MLFVRVLTLFVVSVLPVRATAHPWNAREVGLFADAEGYRWFRFQDAFTPFTLYAVAFDLDGQVKGFEFAVTFPEGYTLLSSTFNGALDFGDVPGEFIVGTGTCLEGSGALVLASLYGGFFVSSVGDDVPICLTGTDPTSFAGGVPGYLQCDGTLVPFGFAQVYRDDQFPPGCIIINPTNPIGLEEPSTFGEMKARY